MKKYKEIKIEAMSARVERMLDEIVCDWCGKNFLIYDWSSHYSFPCGGTINIDFGYGSRFDSHLKEDEYVGDICDDCFENNILSHLRQKKELKK